MLRPLHNPYWIFRQNYTILSNLWQQNSSRITPGFMGDIDISKIKQSKNIRYNVPDTEGPAKSIQQKGLLQPILVRTSDGFFEIVVGNRRFCACKALGWKNIACHIIELGDKHLKFRPDFDIETFN